MSEHYWADGTLMGELETLLYGPVGGLLQKWQKKAIRKAMKQADKVAELKHWFEEAHRLETCVAGVEQENLELKQDLKRIGAVLDTVKSQECQGHYSTMIQQIIDRNKELEESAFVKDREYTDAILLAIAYLAELKDLRIKISKAEKDAKRYLWLTEDHEDYATRDRCRSILERMPVMSYSAACLDIDYAISAQEKP